jgi:mRNA interferase HicA
VLIFEPQSAAIRVMNSKQFKKWLSALGATFAPGKGGHLKVRLNGKYSVLPMSSANSKKAR